MKPRDESPNRWLMLTYDVATNVGPNVGFCVILLTKVIWCRNFFVIWCHFFPIILDHTNFFDVAIQRGARPWKVMPFLAGDEDSEEVGISDNTRGSLPPYWRMVINPGFIMIYYVIR